MVEHFCRQTARKMVERGYAPERARFLARLCYVTAVFTCGAIGATLDPSMKGLAGERDERSCSLPPKGPSDGVALLNRWHGQEFGFSCAPATHFLKILDRLPVP